LKRTENNRKKVDSKYQKSDLVAIVTSM